MGICRMAYLARRTGLESWYLDVWQDRSSGHYGLRLGDSPLLGFGQGWFLLGVGSLWQRSVFWYGFQECLVARVPPGSHPLSFWCLRQRLGVLLSTG